MKSGCNGERMTECVNGRDGVCWSSVLHLEISPRWGARLRFQNRGASVDEESSK